MRGEADRKLFADIPFGCMCYVPASAEMCACSAPEAALRRYAAGEALRPMSVTEREWCVDEADRAGEGFYKADELRALSDQDLACNVLHAWRIYVASQVG